MNINLLVLSTICFIAMISPGPDFLLVTKNSFLYSRRIALTTAFGIVCGCLFHATYCILGLALIITQSTLLYAAIKYLGACYLIYLGIKGFFSKPQQEIDPQSPIATNMTPTKAYLEGLLCNVLNPKLAVFLLSLFTQFVSVNASIWGKTMVAGIFVGESMLYWPLLVLFLQSHHVRKLFTNVQNRLSSVFGALLIYLGIRVMLSAV